MQMTFFNSMFTPYLSPNWTPRSQGGYAGICLFLVFLAAFFRMLIAGKHLIEHRWHDVESKRRYVMVQGTPTEAERIDADSDSKKATLISEQGVEEPVKVVKRTRRPVTPWRFSIDGPRAAYTLLLSTVGYLL